MVGRQGRFKGRGGGESDGRADRPGEESGLPAKNCSRSTPRTWAGGADGDRHRQGRGSGKTTIAASAPVPSRTKSQRWECVVCGSINMSTAVCPACKTPRGRLALSARQSLASVADLTRIELVEEESARRDRERKRILKQQSGAKKGHARAGVRKRQSSQHSETLGKWVSAGCMGGAVASDVLKTSLRNCCSKAHREI